MWPLKGEHPPSCGAAVARQRAELEIDIAVGCKLGEELGRIWVVVAAVALFAHSVVAQRVELEVRRWELAEAPLPGVE